MAYNPAECPVCLAEFDDTELRPHNLPCGHTFCALCLSDIEANRHVICPTCRARHTVPAAGRFPVAYTLEALLRNLRDSSRTPPHRSWQRVRIAEGGLGRRVRSLLQEEEAKILAAISSCQDVQSQLGQYKATLAGFGRQQEQPEGTMQWAMHLVQNARLSLMQEESQIAMREEVLKQGEQLLRTRLEALRRVNTRQEAFSAISDTDQCISSMEHSMGECQRVFPSMDTVVVMRKVRDASGTTMQAVHRVQTSAQSRVPPTGRGHQAIVPDASLTITERLQTLLIPTLKMEDVCSLRQPARSLLEAGLVVIVHQVEGRFQHARVSLVKNQLYLHHLKDQLPPLGAAFLQIGEMVLPSPPCVAFLDLAWPGSATRRVLIHLSTDTPRGRQFVMLCTGQCGHSYANTRLCGVANRGQPGEWVWGGDYERNTGEGGASLLPNLDVGQYLRSGRAGDVWGAWSGDPAKGAQFGINTTERCDGYLFYGVFGQVVSGLDAVMEAAKHVTEVTVVDCGVFFPTFI